MSWWAYECLQSTWGLNFRSHGDGLVQAKTLDQDVKTEGCNQSGFLTWQVDDAPVSPLVKGVCVPGRTEPG